jgi:hypothetical protein
MTCAIANLDIYHPASRSRLTLAPHSFQIKLTPSSPALTTTWPPALPSSPTGPGATATPLTTPAWPLCSATSAPVRTSQVLSIPSADAEVTRWSCGDGCGARDVMGS